MKKIILSFVLFTILIAGCTQDSPLAPENELIVVRGYLYSGEPVTDIQLTTTLPLGSEDTLAPPINNAHVSLSKNDRTYELIPSPGDSGYYHYAGDDLSVETGDIFDLFVEYGGETITGETTVPAPPEDVSLSSDVLTISTGFDYPFSGKSDSTRWIEVTWKEDALSLFYITIDNVEDNPEAIETNGQFTPPGIKRFISAPTNRNDYRIQRFSITHYGLHRVRVYRVNQEYADLYDTRQQDSRDLNEPLTNIVNGLGIFSAFNSIEIYFIAIKGTTDE